MLPFPRQMARRALGASRTWLERVWNELRDHPTLQRYRAELERLIGDPSSLSPEQRRERAWTLVSFTGTFAQTLPTNLLTVVYPPIAMVMVQGIARLHGVRKGARQIALELVGALGGGFLLRFVMRFRPILLHLGAANVAPVTLALGRFAIWYYERHGPPPQDEVRQRLVAEMERMQPKSLPGKTSEPSADRPDALRQRTHPVTGS